MAKAKKKTKTGPLIPIKGKETKVIPRDLADQMKAVEACATAFACLDKGQFSHQWLEPVRASLHFLKSLHAQSMEVAIKHPQAHMVKDEEFKMNLKKLKETPQEEQSSGEEKIS